MLKCAQWISNLSLAVAEMTTPGEIPFSRFKCKSKAGVKYDVGQFIQATLSSEALSSARPFW